MQDALTAARRALAAAKAHAQGARVIEEEGYPVAAILAKLQQRLVALEPDAVSRRKPGSGSCLCPRLR